MSPALTNIWSKRKQKSNKPKGKKVSGPVSEPGFGCR